MSNQNRARWMLAAVTPVLVAATACGGAASESGDGGGAPDKLVVWDWHSGNPEAEEYYEKAKADFQEKHPDVEVEYVAQPFDQYYTLLGTAIEAGSGPDIAMFNGGAQMRDRVDALVPLDDRLGDLTDRLTGWPAFRDGDTTYAVPLTVQGFPFYYNKAIYEKAGLDPEAPPETLDELTEVCEAIKESGTACFTVGNKEGLSIEFFLSGFGPGALTPEQYDAWLAGDRDWNSPEVRQIFELWTKGTDEGWFNKGVNSTAQFMDQYTMFSGGKGGNTIGLISDTAHWKDFDEFLGDDLGVYVGPVINDAVTESYLAAEGGIGYGVMTWTEDPDLAFDLVESLASTEALESFGANTGAVTSDTTVDTSSIDVPAGKQIVEWLPESKPLLHTALSAQTLDLLHRLSQQLLGGDVSIDDALQRLAESDV